MRKTTLLKQYVHAPEILVIPGVPDPLCAKIAAREGFKAVFLSGYACSAAMLGAPDVGLLTLTEMVDCAWRIADATESAAVRRRRYRPRQRHQRGAHDEAVREGGRCRHLL